MTLADRWDGMYATAPPWDTGRPQPALAAIAAEFTGRVLDVGCGSGEHALFVAAAGADATGVDISPAAIRLATAKARERGLTVSFRVADCLSLADLHETWDTVVESNVFQVFDESDRARYARSIRSVLLPGGRFVMLCFSDEEPPGWGPHRISQDQLRDAFTDGWRIDSIDRAIVETRGESTPPKVHAWLTRMTAV
jgi:SAM-dependent methyltransferase